MFKIMKYLGEFKASAAAVILLLILQAYCDLSLPSYTSDIVDVGIEQGGIENAVPEIMRAETLEGICFLSDEDALIRENYRLNEDGNYELQAEEPETIEKLDEAMRGAIVALYQQGENTEELSDIMASQMAVMFVRAEYEALGVDLNAIQTRYLLTTGGKMLLMTITRSTNDIQQIQMVAVMLLRMVCYAPILGVGGIIKVIHTRTGMGWIIIVAVIFILTTFSIFIRFP